MISDTPTTNELPNGCPETVGFSKNGTYCSFSIHEQNSPLSDKHPGCAPEHCHVLEVHTDGTGDRLKKAEERMHRIHAEYQKMRDCLFVLLSTLERHTGLPDFRWPKDAACNECTKYQPADMRNQVVPDFLCARHKAHKLLNPPKS